MKLDLRPLENTLDLKPINAGLNLRPLDEEAVAQSVHDQITTAVPEGFDINRYQQGEEIDPRDLGFTPRESQEVSVHARPAEEAVITQDYRGAAFEALPERSLGQRVGDFFIGDPEQREYLPANASRMEKFDHYFSLIARAPIRAGYKFTKGLLLGTPEIAWAVIKRAVGDEHLPNLKDKSLDEAIDWAMDYNPSGFTQAVSGFSELVGGLKTAGAVLPQASGPVGVVDKAVRQGHKWGLASAGRELSKFASELISTDTDLNYGGAGQVTADWMTGFLYSLGSSGVSAVFKHLKKLPPNEYDQALKAIGLDRKASAKDITARLAQLYRRYHPDKKAYGGSDEAKFKEVIAARDILRRGPKDARDIIYNVRHGTKDKPEIVRQLTGKVQSPASAQANTKITVESPGVTRETTIKQKQIEKFVKMSRTRQDNIAAKTPDADTNTSAQKISGTDKASDSIRVVLKSEGKESKVDHVVDLKEKQQVREQEESSSITTTTHPWIGDKTTRTVRHPDMGDNFKVTDDYYIDLEGLSKEQIYDVNKFFFGRAGVNAPDRIMLRALYHQSAGLATTPIELRALKNAGLVTAENQFTDLGKELMGRVKLTDFYQADEMITSLEAAEGLPQRTSLERARNLRDANIALSKLGEGDSGKDVVGILYQHKIIPGPMYDFLNAVIDDLPEQFFMPSHTKFEVARTAVTQGRINPSMLGSYQRFDAEDYLAGMRDLINLFDSADVNTFLHELGHKIFFRFMSITDLHKVKSLWEKSQAYQNFLGSQNQTHAQYFNHLSEWFAEAFAQYETDRIDAKHDLGKIFRGMKEFLKKIYDRIKKFLRHEPKLKKFFDDFFSTHKGQHADASAMRYAARISDDPLGLSVKKTNIRSNIFASSENILNDQSFIDHAYPRLTYNDLIKRAEAGDLLAQKELDSRITDSGQESKITKERKGLLKDAHVKERAIQELSTHDKKELKKMLFGADSMTFFTDDQIKSYIKELDHLKAFLEDPRNESDVLATELGMSVEQLNVLAKHAVNDYGIVNKILKMRTQNGGYFWKNKTIAARQIRRDQRWAETVVKDHEKSLRTQQKKGRPHNRINDLQSSRYEFSNLQLKTGLPYYDTAEGIEDVSIAARETAGRVVAEELAKPGKETGRVFDTWFLASHNVQTPLINEALTVADDATRTKLLEQMTPAQRDLYEKMYNLLKEDGPAANAIREIRWWEWNNALLEAEQAPNEGIRKILLQQAKALMPPDLAGKKQQAEKDRVLKDGREALAKGKDAFKAWIAKERFGTRQFYFMSEPTSGDLMSGPTSLDLNTKIAQHSRGISGDLREAHTRHGQAETAHRPVLQAVIMHTHRAVFANEVKELKHQFNALLNQTGLNQNDREMIQTWYDNMAGVGQGAGIATWFAEKANNFVWRTFPLQMTKTAHYTTRNLLQNSLIIANLPPHEIMRSGVKLATGKKSQELVETVRDKWGTITQKKGIQEHVMRLKESAEMGDATHTDNLIQAANHYLGNIGGAIITWSDETNRKRAFPILFESGLRNAKEYLSNKRSFDSLRSNLMLDNLDEAQIDKLERILSGGDPPKDFAYWFARYKTENMHYKYNREARGMMEQTRGGRVIFGLANWVRGIWQQVVRNGTQVATRGIRDKDLRTLVEGIMTITGVYVGLRLANETLRAIAGERYYQGYDLIQTFFGVNPGSWGANQIFETYEDITGIISEVLDGTEWDEAKIDKIMDRVSRDTIDWWFPLVDTFIAYTEIENDTSGLSFWKAMRGALDDKYKGMNRGRNHQYERDTIQTMQRIIFGGEKRPNNLRKDWDDYSAYEKFLRIGVGKTANYDTPKRRRGR